LVDRTLKKLNKGIVRVLMLNMLSMPLIMISVFIVHYYTPRFNRTLPSFSAFGDYTLTHTEQIWDNYKMLNRFTYHYSNYVYSFTIQYYENDVQVIFGFEDSKIVVNGIFAKVGNIEIISRNGFFDIPRNSFPIGMDRTIRHTLARDRYGAYWRHVALTAFFVNPVLFFILAVILPIKNKPESRMCGIDHITVAAYLSQSDNSIG